MKVIGNSQFQKSLNGALILNYLLKNGFASRIELAEQLGLQPSTITYIINRFLTIDLIRESESKKKQQGSGRPAVKLKLNPDYGKVVGIEMQKNYYSAVTCDMNGKVLTRMQGEYSSARASFEQKLQQVVTTIRNRMSGQLLGVGIAMPGIVHPENATIEESLAHNIKSLSLSEYIEDTFEFPVILENDANSCALHILWEQREHRTPSFLYVLPRFHDPANLPPDFPAVGIGLGIVIEGKLYRGVNHRAGEFRSAFLNRSDRSELAISVQDTRQMKDKPTIKRRLFTEILQNLGFAVSLLNPSSILIGGDIAGDGELIRSILNEELQPTSQYFKHSQCTIETLQDVTYDPAKGAAANMLTELYKVPQAGMPGMSRRIWSHMLANATR
ncbi:MAG: ROK family transcriptional regulator [Spirochaetia bacterium]|nr:ROK family transcriptional regulator [Spirochaetia bacterium]